MQINTNTTAMKANMAAESAESKAKKELEKIAAARQMAAADNPAGMMIADMLTMEANTLSQGVRNANDAVAYLQVADGALRGVSEGAIKLNELSVAYNNAALGTDSKNALLAEASRLKEGMGDMLNQASFNGKSVFGEASFYVGGGTVNASIQRPNVESADITNQDSVLGLLEETDRTRANIGSTINQAYSSINSNMTAVVSQSAAASQLVDTDMAQASSDYSASYLRSNASLFAAAHSTDYLASQVSRLLG
jgi:flagellin